MAGAGRLRLAGVTVSPDALTFGALSRTGVYAPPASVADILSIDSGNGLGHWELSGGDLVVAAAGQDNLTGVYTIGVTTTTGTRTYQITIEAGVYDVRTQAQYEAAAALIVAPDGKGIAFGANQSVDMKMTDVGGTLFRRAVYSTTPVIFKSRAPASPAIVATDITSSSEYIEFHDMECPVPAVVQTTTASVSGSNGKFQISNSTTAGTRSASGWKWYRCNFYGPVELDVNGDFSGRFTDVSIGTGNGVTTTFSGTLANVPLVYANMMNNESGSNPVGNNPPPMTIKVAGVTVATAQANTATSASPTVNFTGAGVTGTSTVNCQTGEWTLTLTTPPANGAAITADYNQLGLITSGIGKCGIVFNISQTANAPSGVVVQDCTFQDVQYGFRGAPTEAHITGNTFIRFYGSGGMKVDAPYSNSTSLPSEAWIEDNLTYWPVASSLDNGNPHPDMFIATGNINYVGTVIHHFSRNRFFLARTRATAIGVNWRDMNNPGRGGGPTGWFRVLATGNWILGANWIDGAMSVEDSDTSVFEYNTVVSRGGEPGDSTCGFYLGRISATGVNVANNNISEIVGQTAAGFGGTLSESGNVKLGALGVTIPYADAFDGPGFDFEDPADGTGTLVEITAAFTPQAAYAAAGAIGNTVYPE